MSHTASLSYQFEFYAEQQEEGLRGLCVRSGEMHRPPYFRVDVARELRRGQWRDLDPIVHDFLDVVGAVTAADRLARRRLDADGFGWPRELKLAVPVRQLDFWRSGDVGVSLERVLHSLTGDCWLLDWSNRSASRTHRADSHQSALLSAEAVPAEAILHSGGLDAFCGACDLLHSHQRSRFAMVAVQMGGRIMAAQREVLASLNERFPGRAVGFEIPLTLPRAVQDDSLHRSRSFVFIAVGAVAALAQGAGRLYQCENGVAALGLSLFPSAFGWQTFRGTHPKFLSDMASLISKVFRTNFRVENPYLLQTKAQMCSAVRRVGLERAVRSTVSCDRFPQRVEDQPLCGKCGPCLLRRQSLFAAKLHSEDPSDRYRYDVTQSQIALPRDGSQALIGMLDQYERLKYCLAAAEPWESLFEIYPQVEVTKRNIATLCRRTEADVESEILAMLGRYVQEWDLFPIANAWTEPLQMKDRRRVRHDLGGSLELPGLSPSRE